MAKAKGALKTGGRVKGSRNKQNKHLVQIAQELKCDPYEVLIHFVKGDWAALGYSSGVILRNGYEEDLIPPIARLKAAVEACKYIYAQKKAVDTETELTPEEQTFLSIFRERMAEYAAKRVIEDSAATLGTDSSKGPGTDQST